MFFNHNTIQIGQSCDCQFSQPDLIASIGRDGEFGNDERNGREFFNGFNTIRPIQGNNIIKLNAMHECINNGNMTYFSIFIKLRSRITTLSIPSTVIFTIPFNE